MAHKILTIREAEEMRLQKIFQKLTIPMCTNGLTQTILAR